MKKVLIVEDEAALRSVIRAKLESEGYEVMEEADGESGLETALREKPDLILLDVVMPRVDGIEMARRMRQDAWGKDAHIILLTNINSMEQVQAAIENGIFQYFIKTDIKLEELVAQVNEMLS